MRSRQPNSQTTRRAAHLALGTWALLLLTACASAPRTQPQAHSAQVQVPQLPIPQGPPPKPKVALVLGGGAARGFAHVGVIRALEQEKIPIDLVVGTSVGSLIGAIYASELNSFELEWTAFQLEKDHLFDFGVLNAVTGMGLAKGDKLEEWVKTRIKTVNIEQLRRPFAAVATDLNWGNKVVIDQGSVARAVRASSAIPGVFQPVAHMGKFLVDGGVVDNVPTSVAKAKGADLIIAVDISGHLGNPNITNLFGVTMQAMNIMFALNVEQSRKGADVLIHPEGIGDVQTLDFTQKKRCMLAGLEAGQKAVPQIRACMEDWVKKKLAERPAGQAR